MKKQKNKSIKSKKVDKKKMIIKIMCILLMLAIVGIMFIVGVNLYMKAFVKENIIEVKDTSNLNADCIIVLGAGAKNGKPSWMLEDRLLVAEEIYAAGGSQKIIMSGDHGTTSYDEVNTMKNYAIEDEIPSENIFMDHAGFSTYETMYRAKEIFGAKKVIIVTQEYHMYRALYIAKKLGLEAYGVTSDKRDYLSNQKYRVAREWIARVKDFFTVIIHPEPTYLGEPIELKSSGDVTNDKNHTKENN